MAVFCEYTKVAKNKPVYDKLTVHDQISFLAIRYPNIQRAVNKQELHTPGHDLCFPCEAIRAFHILKLPLLQTYFHIFFGFVQLPNNECLGDYYLRKIYSHISFLLFNIYFQFFLQVGLGQLSITFCSHSIIYQGFMLESRKGNLLLG